MKPIALLYLVLLASLVAVPALATTADKHLELVEVNEVIDADSLVTFVGTVENTHTTQPVAYVHAFAILRLEGKVVAIYRGFIENDTLTLAPGELASFSVRTDYYASEYDDFSIRLSGMMAPPEEVFIIGEVSVVEESVNLTLSPEGDRVLYGEIVNNTNAIIWQVDLEINLYDSRGNLAGNALSLDLIGMDLWPGDRREFSAFVTLISNKAITDWEVGEIRIHPVRIVEQSIPTVSTGATWGQIKNHSRAESAD